jgi:hypothetical protein
MVARRKMAEGFGRLAEALTPFLPPVLTIQVQVPPGLVLAGLAVLWLLRRRPK